MSRTLVISDVHGDLRSLDALLELLGPGEGDLVITLGDYVNRGPDSPGVIERLIGLHRTHRVVSLIGNHDRLMLDARWNATALDLMRTIYEGQATIDAYGGSLGNIPASHVEFLERTCRLYHETATHIFVHGGVEPDVAIEKQDPEVLVSRRVHDARAHRSGKVVVCGHTRQFDTKPLNLGHTVCIDCDQHLTGLHVETGEVTQVHRATGEVRRLMI